MDLKPMTTPEPDGSTASLRDLEDEIEDRTEYSPEEKYDMKEPVVEPEAVAVDLGKKVKVKDAPTAANTYAAKKTVAQGMMDIALITANANQLRYLIEYNRNSPTFYLNVTLIVISLLLQVAVGVSLIFKGRFDLVGESKMAHANRLNNYVVVGVFMVTIINVFVAAFSISGDPTTSQFTPPVVQRGVAEIAGPPTR